MWNALISSCLFYTGLNIQKNKKKTTKKKSGGEVCASVCECTAFFDFCLSLFFASLPLNLTALELLIFIGVDLGITDAICLAVAVFPKKFEVAGPICVQEGTARRPLSECLHQQ
jgi:hypothetical protein